MAAFVGVVVLGTIWGAVLSQGRGAAVQMGLADAELASRGAAEVLLQDLRMAGYGMLGVPASASLPPIQVTSVGGVTTITLRGAYTNTQSTIAQSTPAGSTSIDVVPPAEGAFVAGERVLVDSGLNAEVKTITSVTANGGTISLGLSSALQNQYPLGPNVTQIEEVQYSYDGTLLRRNGDVLVDATPSFQLQYVDQAGNVTTTPGSDLRAVIVDLEAAPSSSLPGNPSAHAELSTEVQVRNLAFRFTLG